MERETRLMIFGIVIAAIVIGLIIALIRGNTYKNEKGESIIGRDPSKPKLGDTVITSRQIIVALLIISMIVSIMLSLKLFSKL